MIATTWSVDKNHAVQGLPVILCLLTFHSDFYHEEGCFLETNGFVMSLKLWIKCNKKN